MLVLRRNEGDWTNVEISAERLKELVKNGKGAKLRFRVYNITEEYHEDVENGGPGYLERKVNLAFEDDDHNFNIQRPERIARGSRLKVRDND